MFYVKKKKLIFYFQDWKISFICLFLYCYQSRYGAQGERGNCYRHFILIGINGSLFLNGNSSKMIIESINYRFKPSGIFFLCNYPSFIWEDTIYIIYHIFLYRFSQSNNVVIVFLIVNKIIKKRYTAHHRFFFKTNVRFFVWWNCIFVSFFVQCHYL
jgi:hypothetical protein